MDQCILNCDMLEQSVNIVILSAGKGTRMNTDLPKVLHKVAGLSLFEHVLNTIHSLQFPKNIITITSADILDNFKQSLPDDKDLHYIIQEERKGTGHAVQCAVNCDKWQSDNKYTAIFYADVPFIKNTTIEQMFDLLKFDYDLVVLGFDAEDQTRAYGRLFTETELSVGQSGKLFAIKEFRDLPREKPRLCNSGTIIGKTEIFEKLLPKIKNNNNAKEYYLTDIIELANQSGYKIGTFVCNEYEVMGINSLVELETAEHAYQRKLREKHMLNGVVLLNADSIYFHYDTEIGSNTIIESNVFFGKGVKIGNNCTIKAGCYLEQLTMKENCSIGPYARVRVGATVENNVHIGNFVEIKNSKIGERTKIGHFCYIGDTTIGKYVNIGAGVVVCNYDGKQKYETIIGDKAFVGSNSTIIAPVIIEEESYVAGGSTITKNVEKHSLGIARSRQKNITGFSI